MATKVLRKTQAVIRQSEGSFWFLSFKSPSSMLFSSFTATIISTCSANKTQFLSGEPEREREREEKEEKERECALFLSKWASYIRGGCGHKILLFPIE